MQSILEMMREMAKMVEQEQERLLIERIPNHKGPNRFQRLMMQHVADVTGFAVIQDKGSGVQLVGAQLMLTSKGCFTQARFNPKLPKDCIIMNTNSDDPYWYSVFFHEMAHATGVPKLLDRKGLSGDKDLLDYAFEEMIAETVASTIMEQFGFATETTRLQSQNYLYHYELHFRMTQGQAGWRDIDRAKLKTDSDAALAQVLQWVGEFNPRQIETVMERVKEFNRFF